MSFIFTSRWGRRRRRRTAALALNLPSLVKKDVSVDSDDVAFVENSRVNVVEMIPLTVGRVFTRRSVVTALKVRPVMVADCVKVVDVVVGRDGRVWRKLRKRGRRMTWATLWLAPRCWQSVPHFEAVRGCVSVLWGRCVDLSRSLRHALFAAAAAVPMRHVWRHVETLERKFDGRRQFVARRSRRTALSKTFEVDDQNVRRCPQNHLGDDFLLPVAGRTEPGLALTQFFCSSVKAEAFLKRYTCGLFWRFGDLCGIRSVLIASALVLVLFSPS